MVVTRLFSIKARWCNLCSAHNKDRKCDLLYSSVSLCRSSMDEFSISVHNSFYGWFLMSRQCAKEVEVEEVLVEENFETQTMKRNNLRVFKCSEKWKDRLLWLSAEDGKMFCSHCKEFDKKCRNKFISGCESMHIENVHSLVENPGDYWISMGKTRSLKRPRQ